jgi:hypothetical protein
MPLPRPSRPVVARQVTNRGDGWFSDGGRGSRGEATGGGPVRLRSPTHRLHSMIGNMPPIEYEDNYYAHQPDREAPISGEPSLH